MTTSSVTHMALPGPRGLANARYIRRLFSDPAPALDSLRAEYGPICGLGYPGVRLAIIGDPAFMHEMFSMKADAFRWNHKFNVIGVRFVVGKHSMIVSDGTDHQRRRGAVQQAFTRQRLNGWIPMIVQRTDTAINQLIASTHDSEHTVDLYPFGRDLTLGITIHAFFGERLTRRTAEFSDLFQRAQAFIEAPAIKQLPHPFPHTARSRVRADRKAIDHIIDEEVADRRAVVHESLRLHPAGLIGARVAAADLQLGNHPISKGTLIVWSPHLAGRDHSVWADRSAWSSTDRKVEHRSDSRSDRRHNDLPQSGYLPDRQPQPVHHPGLSSDRHRVGACIVECHGVNGKRPLARLVSRP